MTGTAARSTACLLLVVACRSTPDPSAAPGTVVADSGILVRRVTVGERFSPQSGDAALRAFIPAVPPAVTGGECRLTRTRPGGATTVTAYFPSVDSARTMISLMFDTAGNLVRFSDRRGIVRFGGRGASAQQLDSLRRAADAKVRSTTISLDYPIDQAIATNSGGGEPTEAVIGTIPAMERLDKLGPPVERIRLARRLCSV